MEEPAERWADEAEETSTSRHWPSWALLEKPIACHSPHTTGAIRGEAWRVDGGALPWPTDATKRNTRPHTTATSSVPKEEDSTRTFLSGVHPTHDASSQRFRQPSPPKRMAKASRGEAGHYTVVPPPLPPSLACRRSPSCAPYLHLPWTTPRTGTTHEPQTGGRALQRKGALYHSSFAGNTVVATFEIHPIAIDRVATAARLYRRLFRMAPERRCPVREARWVWCFRTPPPSPSTSLWGCCCCSRWFLYRFLVPPCGASHAFPLPLVFPGAPPPSLAKAIPPPFHHTPVLPYSLLLPVKARPHDWGKARERETVLEGGGTRWRAGRTAPVGTLFLSHCSRRDSACTEDLHSQAHTIFFRLPPSLPRVPHRLPSPFHYRFRGGRSYCPVWW